MWLYAIRLKKGKERAMNKAFNSFTWENDPSIDTPLSAEILNLINNAVDTIDDRVITLDTTKVEQTDVATVITNVALDESTGIFTFTRKDGSEFTVDTKLEKLVLNWRFDAITQTLYLILEDGTEMPIDLSSFITPIEFADSDTIFATINSDGTVSFGVKNGSITPEKLEPNYLANITIQAERAALSASESATSALKSAEEADKAETEANRAETEADRAEEAAARAEQVSAVEVATPERLGIVKPDNSTIVIDANGTISVQSELLEFISKTTVFNEDGSIVETSDIGTKTTVFNEDGSIVETLVTENKTYTKTTTFSDNEINEEVS